MTPQNYNIIACDGGGIRGLLTAMLAVVDVRSRVQS